MSASNNDIHRLLLRHLQRRPEMAVVDFYKMCHQATIGCTPGPNTARARKLLQEELARVCEEELPPGDSVLLEAIDAQDNIVRVNLRLYHHNGGDLDSLFEAFQFSNESRNRSAKELERYWWELTAMAGEGLCAFSREDASVFFSCMEEQGFPSVHHSRHYVQLYKPAYRVIAAYYAKKLL